MKLKPLEYLFIILAIIFAIGAFTVQQIEPETAEYTQEETLQTPPTEFFVDAETVELDTLEVNHPDQANQTVQQFFTLFAQINTNQNNEQLLLQAKSLLSKNIQTEISNEQSQATRDLSRIVGMLTPPKEVRILRTEQSSPEKIDVIIDVTTENNQKIQKRVSTVNEENLQKIDSFTILE